jgi:hypothetical protein
VPEVEDPSCAGLVAAGVRHAQAGELDAAERSLTASLSCGGAAPLRELAGVRLLQRRWTEVSELASAALAADPKDGYAWQLLATSRFVQNDSRSALAAWNRVEQPRVDLVSVGGLERTRQRVVERLLAVRSQTLLTPALFDRSARRLGELPSAQSSRLEIVPKPGGLVELRAHVVERQLIPSDAWGYAAIGLMAAARNEIAWSTGSLTGGGERIDVGWRFWPGRPRVALGVTAPAPWGGLWGVDAFGERQPFSDDAFPTSRRAGAGISLSNWITARARVAARTGIDSWDGIGTFGVTAGILRLASTRDRVTLDVTGSGWMGQDSFASWTALARVRTSNQHRGRVFVAYGGGALATIATPPDRWFAGDTGAVRPALLRAHPIVDEGRLQSDRLGRGIAHASGEVRQWWTIRSAIHLGAAAFADTVRVARQVMDNDRGDVDVGGGLRLALPGLEGVFRLDLGKGLRDGATAVSFVYEP